MLCVMKRLYLSPEEKVRLEQAHALKENGKERDRLKAILLRSEGWTVPLISQALRIHQTSIIRHINDYKEGKLTNENGGSKSYLTEEQTAELIAHLEENLYHHNHQIILYVKERFGVTFTVPGMHKWLHRNEFSYKKPKGQPHKSDSELQKQFVDEYKALKSTAGEDEPILFIDSVHPTQATKISYGWIKTGQEKVVGTTASRTRINLVGAIQLGHLSNTITAQYDTINGESIADFLNRLRNQFYESKTIHLILDRSGYHRSDTVAKEAKKLGIKLHFLPAYSPNLNPIERLWKVMNEHTRNNKFFKSAKEFKDAIRLFFELTLPDIGSSLNSRINDNFQILET